MPLLLRHRLSIPALLAVGALGCGADDDDDATSVADTSSTSDSESSAGPTTDPTADPTTDPSTDPSAETSASESSSEASSEAGTTSAETGTESADTGSTTGVEMCFGDGSMPACDIETQRECETVDICLWVKPGYCSANCTVITDATTCCEQFECAWMDGACDYNAI